MEEDTKKDRSYLINFALRMLCEAGGPDGLFQQKTRAILMESFGCDNVEALLDIIYARVAVLAGMEPGGLGQVGGPFLMICDVTQQPEALSREEVAESSRDVPRGSDPINSVLHFILSELEHGAEPSLDDAAIRAAMDKNTLARVLSDKGVVTSRVRRGGKRGQYLLADQLHAVKQALGVT